MRVARQGQLRFQLGFIECLSHFELKGVARQKSRGCQTVQRRARRDQHHIGIALRYAPQGGQAFADQVLVRRKTVVGQCFPIGKQHAAQVGRKKRHFVLQALRIQRISGDDGDALTVCFLA